MKRILSVLLMPFRWYKKRSRKWKVIIAIVVMAFIIVIIRQLTKGNGDEYELTTPSRESIVEYVTETGNVVSSNAIPIFSTTNGVVQEMLVSNDTPVTKGQELFYVTSSATEQEKATAWSNYLLAQTTLESAKATEYSLQASMFNDWDTYRNKYDAEEYEDIDDPDRNEPDFQVPEKQWLAAEAQYKNQQEVVAQKQADLNAKWLSYQTTQDSTVTTPIDGTIQNLSSDIGQVVSAFSALSSPNSVLMVMTDAKTAIKIDINETDYKDIEPGQTAHIEVDALGNGILDGKVIRVDKIGKNTQGVVTYGVYIELDEENPAIQPGMTTTVDIEVARKDNALTVPSSAVKPYQGGKAVRVVDAGGEIEYVSVEIGVTGNKMTEIVSGIDENTEVITALKNEQIERSGGGLFGR